MRRSRRLGRSGSPCFRGGEACAVPYVHTNYMYTCTHTAVMSRAGAVEPARHRYLKARPAFLGVVLSGERTGSNVKSYINYRTDEAQTRPRTRNTTDASLPSRQAPPPFRGREQGRSPVKWPGPQILSFLSKCGDPFMLKASPRIRHLQLPPCLV